MNFVKELPNIYIIFLCFLALLSGYLYTGDSNLFTLCNLSLGSLVTIARSSYKRGTEITGDIETQNIELERRDENENV